MRTKKDNENKERSGNRSDDEIKIAATRPISVSVETHPSTNKDVYIVALSLVITIRNLHEQRYSKYCHLAHNTSAKSRGEKKNKRTSNKRPMRRTEGAQGTEYSFLLHRSSKWRHDML